MARNGYGGRGGRGSFKGDNKSNRGRGDGPAGDRGAASRRGYGARGERPSAASPNGHGVRSRSSRTSRYDADPDRLRGGSGGSRPGGRSRGGVPPKEDLFHTDLSKASISRHSFLLLGLGFCSILAVARLADYQIFNVDRYRAEADSRRKLNQTLYAKRGTMYDRNGNVLVSSVECKNVYVNPQLIKKKDISKTVDGLVEVLGVDEKTVRKLVESDGTFAYVKRQVDMEDVEVLQKKNLAGVEFEDATKRVYPNGTLASQVLGAVDLDNKGLTGLEKQYDEVLTGKNGSLIRERALDGSYIAGGAYKKEPAEDGMDIVLTLDANIQSAAEEALAAAVESSGAKYGSTIVTDPTTGEILAACSYPTYDPLDLQNARSEDLNLRLVTDAYEPGSVFKTYVSAAGIDLGVVTPDTTFSVPAVVKVGDDEVRDVDGRAGTMNMTLREILRRSSNTGMVLVGERIGADDFDREVIDGFGFRESTGVDFPGETPGVIKDRDEYDGASLGSMSFGQSLAVAPIRMARAMSAIANKGIMTTPHFLKSRGGEEVDWTENERRACSEDAASQVADMMLTVVDEGTGEGAQIPGYEISGKTGTAERAGESGGYEAGNNMASFMGFVSTRDPRVLCYTTLDGTPAMSYAATPVFKAVMETALQALGIDPTR